jgi:hypothetical protein
VVDLADAALYAVKHGGRNGWVGVMQATAPSAEALRAAARQPLAQWAASGDLQLAAREGWRPSATAQQARDRPGQPMLR